MYTHLLCTLLNNLGIGVVERFVVVKRHPGIS